MEVNYMGYIYKIFILIFITFNLFGENIALKKQIIGTFNFMEKLNDNIKSADNFSQVIKKAEKDEYIIVVLANAKYIRKIKLYWVNNNEPLKYKIELGKNLFSWEKSYLRSLSKKTIENGLIIDEVDIPDIPAFFIKLTITESKNVIVKLSEIEIFPGELEKEIIIKDFKFQEIKENSVKVSFDTDPESFGYIRIGEDVHSLQAHGFELDLYKTHIIEAAGLLSGTEYYIQPVATDVNGKTKMGEIYKVKTKGIPLPRSMKFDAYDVSDFTSKISILFNVPVKVEIYIKREDENFKQIYDSKNFSVEFRFKIKGLIPDTKFILKALGTDSYGNKTEKVIEFITKSENIAYGKRVYGNFWGSGEIVDLNINQKITDGNLEEDGIAISGFLSKQENYAIIDLGNLYKLRNIEVIWRSVNFPCKFDVYIGTELKNEKMILVKKDINVKQEGVKIASRGDFGLIYRKVDINCKGEQARYVKIVIPQNTPVCSDLPFEPLKFVGLGEVRVYKIFDYPAPSYEVETE